MSDQTIEALRGHPIVTGFHDEPTGSIQYVVADPGTKRCAIIDPVLDFDPKSGATAKVTVLYSSGTRPIDPDAPEDAPPCLAHAWDPSSGWAAACDASEVIGYGTRS